MGNLIDERLRFAPVIVMGVSGCGKTTVGRALASRLNATFLDADDFHPEANVAKMRAGTPLNDDDRAPWLAALNQELRMRSVGADQVVLACSSLKQAYRVAIGHHLPQARWIFLDGSFELIAARMRERPNHYMPESLLRSQFDALERPVDAITISIELSADEQVAAACDALRLRERSEPLP